MVHSNDDGTALFGGRGAVFARGAIGDQTEVTFRYDSEHAHDRRRFDDIRPDEGDNLFGDASISGFEAQSTERLYARVDNGRSYALYGDFMTDGLDPIRRLGAYTRGINGARVHGEGGNIALDAWGTHDRDRQVVDELPGRGISGPYPLSRKDGVLNSEKVEIVTRDRNNPSVILERKTLVRFADYTIEPFTGRLLFRAPVASLDERLNPVSIRVSYEVEGGGDRFWTAGGSAHLKPVDRIELMGNYVKEDDPLKEHEQFGAGTTLRVLDRTYLTGEWAHTDSSGTLASDAYRGEIRHGSDRLDLRAFGVRTDPGFANASSGYAPGREEWGGEARYRARPPHHDRGRGRAHPRRRDRRRPEGRVARARPPLLARALLRGRLPLGARDRDPGGRRPGRADAERDRRGAGAPGARARHAHERLRRVREEPRPERRRAPRGGRRRARHRSRARLRPARVPQRPGGSVRDERPAGAEHDRVRLRRRRLRRPDRVQRVPDPRRVRRPQRRGRDRPARPLPHLARGAPDAGNGARVAQVGRPGDLARQRTRVDRQPADQGDAAARVPRRCQRRAVARLGRPRPEARARLGRPRALAVGVVAGPRADGRPRRARAVAARDRRQRLEPARQDRAPPGRAADRSHVRQPPRGVARLDADELARGPAAHAARPPGRQAHVRRGLRHVARRQGRARLHARALRPVEAIRPRAVGPRALRRRLGPSHRRPRRRARRRGDEEPAALGRLQRVRLPRRGLRLDGAHGQGTVRRVRLQVRRRPLRRQRRGGARRQPSRRSTRSAARS